jgi:hypothetical protein
VEALAQDQSAVPKTTGELSDETGHEEGEAAGAREGIEDDLAGGDEGILEGPGAHAEVRLLSGERLWTGRSKSLPTGE